jgi:hypothetical protein
MIAVARDGKIYGQEGDREGLIASPKVDMIVQRDNFGNPVNFEAVYYNKIYTGFGCHDLPPMGVSAGDIPEDTRNQLITLLTGIWDGRIVDFLNGANGE